MDLIESIVLGIVQGLTEFLPVSSSAHLLMVPWIMGWEEPPFVFDTSLHIGTLIALFIYFRKDVANLIRGFFKVLKTRNINSDSDGKLAVYVLAGTVPAGVIGVLFEKKIEEKLHSPYIIVVTLILWGILLWAIDRFSSKKRDINSLGMRDALFIGLSQALALIPGTSRSGVTMTAARFSNFNRETAARFSFLLSIPITTAAALYKLKDLFKMNITQDVIINFSVGVIVSGVVGYLCIAYLLKFLKTNSFAVFAIYRIIAGVVLAVTLPNLLQTRIDMQKVDVCRSNTTVADERDEHYIFVKAGETLKLTPEFINKSSDLINNLNLEATAENKLVEITNNENSEFSMDPNSSYPVSMESNCDQNKGIDLKIDNNAKLNSKIKIRFTVKNNLTGKRVDFEQELKVK